MNPTVSVIIPFLNEEESIPLLYEVLCSVTASLPHTFEFLFVNDGSTDGSARVLAVLAMQDPRVRVVTFTRNFGKEAATTAGLCEARGDCAVMIDADLQHPPHYLGYMLERWEAGVEVVVGVRIANQGEGFIKKRGSQFFHSLLNAISQQPLVHGETDFRLIDRRVIDAYNELSERHRMTRQLINWLGFSSEHFYFEAPERVAGTASYSPLKLLHLAASSFTRHSMLPLRLAGIIGVLITFLSFMFGAVVFINRYIFGDPLGWYMTGTSQLAILNVFLIGLVLTALGLIALYIENIHIEVSGRPLYVVRRNKV